MTTEDQESSLNSILPMPLFSFQICVMNHKVIFYDTQFKTFFIEKYKFLLGYSPARGKYLYANLEKSTLFLFCHDYKNNLVIKRLIVN